MLEPMIVLFFDSKLKDNGHHRVSVGIRTWYHGKSFHSEYSRPFRYHRKCCSPVLTGSLDGPWYDVKSVRGVESCRSVMVL